PFIFKIPFEIMNLAVFLFNNNDTDAARPVCFFAYIHAATLAIFLTRHPKLCRKNHKRIDIQLNIEVLKIRVIKSGNR
ncbi:MAG: hypothetical protein LBR51_02505, partial [Bacteroidales bacterium]|nr:hypothetical protein [Bacteroidales bacterium]